MRARRAIEPESTEDGTKASVSMVRRRSVFERPVTSLGGAVGAVVQLEHRGEDPLTRPPADVFARCSRRARRSAGRRRRARRRRPSSGPGAARMTDVACAHAIDVRAGAKFGLDGHMFALTYAARYSERGWGVLFRRANGNAEDARPGHGVLDLFTVDAPEWGATAVARSCGSPSRRRTSSCSACRGGLLQRVGAGRYRLGWRIVALNAVLVETSDLLRLAAPEMRALVRFGRRSMWRSGTGGRSASTRVQGGCARRSRRSGSARMCRELDRARQGPARRPAPGRDRALPVGAAGRRGRPGGPRPGGRPGLRVRGAGAPAGTCSVAAPIINRRRGRLRVARHVRDGRPLGARAARLPAVPWWRWPSISRGAAATWSGRSSSRREVSDNRTGVDTIAVSGVISGVTAPAASRPLHACRGSPPRCLRGRLLRGVPAVRPAGARSRPDGGGRPHRYPRRRVGVVDMGTRGRPFSLDWLEPVLDGAHHAGLA